MRDNKTLTPKGAATGTWRLIMLMLALVAGMGWSQETWAQDTYTVTLNTNGGTINSGNVTSYTYGTGATLPTDVTQSGFIFGGWYDNRKLTGEAVTEIAADATGDKTFYAKWKPIAVVQVLHNFDDAVGSTEPVITYGEGNTVLTVGETELTALNIEPAEMEGETLTIIATPSAGYGLEAGMLRGYYMEGLAARPLPLTQDATDHNKYTFTMTANRVFFEWEPTPAYEGDMALSMEDGKITATFDGNSDETLSIPTSILVDAVTLSRTFTVGKPATLMLPFSLYDGQSLTGGTLYKFTGVTYDEGTSKWVATMTETSTLNANTPYLLLPNGDLVDGKPTFNLDGGSVTLNTTTAGVDSNDDDENWEFQGTYEKKIWNALSNDYGFAAKSKTSADDGHSEIEKGDFVRCAAGASIKPMRCYLHYKVSPALAPARTRAAADDGLPSTITVRFVSAGGTPTAIGTLNTETGEMTIDAWYSLSGTKLPGKPTQKGLYINNGKKVIIK